MERFDQFSQRIIPTESFSTLQEFTPESGGLYLYGSSDENRSVILQLHMEKSNLSNALLEDDEADIDNFILTYKGNRRTLGLYNQSEQDAIWQEFNSPVVYIDITGLSHHIWAVLLASALRVSQPIRMLYVEPEEYSRSQTTANLYDLSNEYEQMRALPGFDMFQQPGEQYCYVPILGFEGIRFKIATIAMGPPRNKVYPIVGLPGFRPEYPFEAYVANQQTLDDASDFVYNKIKFVDAGCPFSLYYIMQDLAEAHNNDTLKIALFGTKPHALGAVLYAIFNEDRVQLLYDFPKRKQGRTVGIGRIYVYHVTFFVSLLTASVE
ncbi:hypothetical protein [Hymenobacter sp. UYP22]|uniref:hypothetical protein n=1 Tax=Hymenobacter sp. UYP22 TaxID=3156348 RepID=UPI00339A657E